MFIKLQLPIHSTSGRATATSAAIVPRHRDTSRLTLWAGTTSTNMEPGATHLIMARYGPRRLLPVGRRTPPVTGFGKPRGDGPGLITSLGDSPPSTMAVGFMPAASGDGRPARFTFVRTMPRRWSRGLAAALEWDLVSAEALDGARSV